MLCCGICCSKGLFSILILLAIVSHSQSSPTLSLYLYISILFWKYRFSGFSNVQHTYTSLHNFFFFFLVQHFHIFYSSGNFLNTHSDRTKIKTKTKNMKLRNTLRKTNKKINQRSILHFSRIYIYIYCTIYCLTFLREFDYC